MDHAVSRLVDVFDYKGNKKYNGVACHDIKIAVVHCNVNRLTVAARQLGNGLGNIAKISGSYIVVVFISLAANLYQARLNTYRQTKV
jgi:hypothetical protein